MIRVPSTNTRNAMRFYLKPSAGSVQIKPLIGSAERMISRVRRKRISLPVFLSIIYYRGQAIFTGGGFECTDEYRETRTRSEPVPAWCRCNDDGTHFFLCIGYFRFHDTSDRFDTKRMRNARLMCRPSGRARNSRDSRKFYFV